MFCLLDKASLFFSRFFLLVFFFYEKHPQSLLYNIAASMWGLLMFYLKCFYLHLVMLGSGWRFLKAFRVRERMVRAWVLSHTVFKRSHKSTMIHWQTWDFQHSDHSNTSPLASSCSCGSQSGTLKIGTLPNYWSTSPWNIRHNVCNSAVQTTSSSWPPLHSRHNMAHPPLFSIRVSLIWSELLHQKKDFKAKQISPHCNLL